MSCPVQEKPWWDKPFFCKFGLHVWDGPGGHCEECGKCDRFFENGSPRSGRHGERK